MNHQQLADEAANNTLSYLSNNYDLFDEAQRLVDGRTFEDNIRHVISCEILKVLSTLEESFKEQTMTEKNQDTPVVKETPTKKKRAPSSYNNYVSEQSKLPEYEGMNFKDRSQAISAKWKTLSKEDKDAYKS
jgi:hypothetical protein